MWRMRSHFRHFLEVGGRGAGEGQPRGEEPKSRPGEAARIELRMLAGRSAAVRLARQGSVVKYKFHYYSGMTKPTNQKSTAIEERVCYIHRSQEKRACPALPGRATRGSSGVSRRQRG